MQDLSIRTAQERMNLPLWHAIENTIPQGVIWQGFHVAKVCVKFECQSDQVRYNLYLLWPWFLTFIPHSIYHTPLPVKYTSYIPHPMFHWKYNIRGLIYSNMPIAVSVACALSAACQYDYSLFTLRKPRAPLRINGEQGFLEWTDYKL